MQDQILIFSYPSWWLIPAALFSLAIAWLLYSKKDQPWSRTTNILLASLRFLTVFFSLSLLLDPIANLITYEEERPIVVVAVDNSTSVLQNTDSAEIRAHIDDLVNALEENNYDWRLYDLLGRTSRDQLSFTANRTNLNQQFKSIERDHENQNLAAIISLSDGIITSGFLPSRSSFGQPIHSLGLGDTIPPRDVRISSVRANEVVYQGNLFEAAVLLTVNGFEGESAQLTLLKNGVKEVEREIALNQVQEVVFSLDTETAGLYRYTAVIETMEGEVTDQNNSFDFYVDVIDGKENILIASSAPHPDIRAIRSALSTSKNYDTYVYIPGINEIRKDLKYDVLIYHNAFERSNRKMELQAYEELPTLYIINERPDVSTMANKSGLELIDFSNQTDEITPAYNSAFSKFSLSSDLTNRLNNYPSINVPYATYEINGPQETLLFQQVGRIATSKPLLTFYDDGSKKHATFAGKGLWKWKLQEAAVSGNSELFDQILLKTVQYLSVRNDKKRLIAMPSERMFEVGKPISFKVEIYNNIYERVSSQPFTISISNGQKEERRFEFVSNTQLSDFEIGNLEAGTYNFTAQTTVDGELATVNGQFIVKEVQLEDIKQQADHHLLRQVARNTNGKYYAFAERNQLLSLISSSQYPGIIRSENDYIPIRTSGWILGLIIFLATTEWFFRKYLGSY